jgi:hypothetical protein
LELTQFRGHPIVGAERSVHDAEEPSAVLAGVPELAYAGDPAKATIEKGEQLIQRLAEMVVGEVREALGLPTG